MDNQILDLLTWFTTLPNISHIIILVIVLVYSIINIWHYVEYIYKKRNKTISLTINFIDRRISDIKINIKDNIERIINKQGTLTSDSYREMQRYCDRLAVVLIEIKHLCKQWLKENGYYELYLDRNGNAKKIEEIINSRGTTIHNMLITSLEDISDPSSLLSGKFNELLSEDEAIEVYRQIISNHVGNIHSEEKHIRNFGKQKFSIFYKFITYHHSDNE